MQNAGKGVQVEPGLVFVLLLTGTLRKYVARIFKANSVFMQNQRKCDYFRHSRNTTLDRLESLYVFQETGIE